MPVEILRTNSNFNRQMWFIRDHQQFIYLAKKIAQKIIRILRKSETKLLGKSVFLARRKRTYIHRSKRNWKQSDLNKFSVRIDLNEKRRCCFHFGRVEFDVSVCVLAKFMWITQKWVWIALAVIHSQYQWCFH